MLEIITMPENKIKHFFGSSLFLFGAFALTIFLGFVYGRAYYQDYQVQMEIKDMQGEVKRLEAKKLESLDVLKYARTTAFLEAKARTEFNLAKPGENMAIIKRKVVEKHIGQRVQKVLESISLPTYQQWWNIFFKN